MQTTPQRGRRIRTLDRRPDSIGRLNEYGGYDYRSLSEEGECSQCGNRYVMTSSGWLPHLLDSALGGAPARCPVL